MQIIPTVHPLHLSSRPRWKARLSRGAFLAGIALIASACGSDSSATVAPGMGTLQLKLTDAPFPFDSVERADLFVVRIDGKVADADSADCATGIDDDSTIHSRKRNHDPSRGWVTLATPNQSYNLLELQSGKTVNLGQATLPTGSYRGFRLILDTDRSSVTLKNGTVLTGNSRPGIKFPSAGRSGIKVVLHKPVSVTSGGTVLVLDFDLGKSFVMRGHTISHNGLLFKPVIRGTAHDVTGMLTGFVRALSADGNAVANATVEVLKPGTLLGDTVSANVVATTQSDSTGKYTVGFLLPGVYAIRATPPSASPYIPALITGLTIVTGTTATAPVIVLPLPAPPTPPAPATPSDTLRP
jgi:hypothetical protein